MDEQKREEEARQIKRIIQRADALVSERSSFAAHWNDIAKVMSPVVGNFSGTTSIGMEHNTSIFDTTGSHANELLASGFFSLLTSPTIPWFYLDTENKQISKDPSVRAWLDEVTKIMTYEIQRPQTGFTTAMHEFYLEYGAYGNGTMFITEKSDMSSLLFTTLPLSECYYTENDEGFVTSLTRLYSRTSLQLIERFGESAVSEKILQDSRQKEGHTRYEIYHVIMPKNEVGALYGKNTSLPYTSIYIEKDTKKVLSISGFDEQPFMAARFYKLPQEAYGRGPGTTALPDMQMLQEMSKTTLRGAQKMVDPPLQMPDQGFVTPPNMAPGRMNYFRSGNGDRIEPIQSGGRPELGLDLIQSYQVRVREIFFVDQLQLNNGPQMTATEVMQRTEEKQRLMGPVIGRASTELLSPLIMRCFGLLLRAGKLPEPPAAFLQSKPKLGINYTSPIFKAQEQVAANNIMRTMQVLTPLMSVDPTIMDVFHPERIARGVADLYSLDSMFLRTEDEVAELQAQRAEQQAQMAATEEAAQLRDTGIGLNNMASASQTVGEVL